MQFVARPARHARHARTSRLALVACVATFSASGCLAPDNPFDPDAPAELQARARVDVKVVDALGPVAATLSLTDADGKLTETARDDGTFSFEVAPGVRTLTVEHPTHVPVTRDLVLIAGETRTVDVVLANLVEGDGTGRISGIARKAAVVDDDVPDHSGIIVEIVDVGARTVTSSSGQFDFVVAPGTYQLALQAQNHLPTTISDVIVVEGETAAPDTVTLPINPGSLAGTVTLEPLVPGGETHGGVTVSAGAASMVTLDDDAYQLTGLPAGPIAVRYTRPEYESVERLVVVTAGQLSTLEPVRLVRATGTVTGTVDLGLADNGGVTVTLTGSSGTFSGVSAQSGSFSLTGVPSGTYDVAATLAGFVPGSGGTVTVVPGATVNIADPILLLPLIGDFAIDGGALFTADPDVDLTIVSDGAVQMRLSEDAGFTGVTAVPFDGSPTFSLSPGDGAKTIFLELIDADGNATGPFSASITLDATAPLPVSFAINGGAPFTNDADGIVALSLAAADETSGVDAMQISTDGTFDTEPFVPFSTSLVTAVSPNVDGSHPLAVRFRDRAGNVNDEADALLASITLDREVPVVAAVRILDATTGSASFAFSPFVSLEVDGSSDAVAMAVSTDPLFPVELFQAFAASSSVLLAPGEGTRTLSVKLKDAAGNVSTAVTDAIVVDTTPPGAPAILLGDGADVTADRTPALSLSAQDATEVRISLTGDFDPTGADFVGTFPTVAPDLGADGTKTVFAQFRDVAGNVSAVASDTIVIDTAAPVLGAAPVSINGGDAFTRSVSVTASLDVAGASLMAVAVDGTVDTEEFQPFTQSFTALLPAGDCAAASASCKSVCVKLKDQAGNVTSQVCDAITLDTTVPSAPLIVENDSVVQSGTFTLHLVEAAQDEFFDHFEVLIDPVQPEFLPVAPGAAVDGKLPIALSLLEPAVGASSSDAAEPNIIRVIAVDRAGNLSPESAVTIIVDNVPPPAPVLAGIPDPVNADTVSVNFTSENLAANDATFRHYLVDTSLLPVAFATTLRDGIVVTLLPNQQNVITVQAVDDAGNVGPASQVTTREDSNAPFAPTVSPISAVVRASQVEIDLLAPSLDVFDLNNDATIDPLTEAVEVTQYQLKDGNGEGFRPVGDSGPFMANLRPGRDNEICVRGVDDAGNVGIEDCAIITEASLQQATRNVDRARVYDVFGDAMFFQSLNRVMFRDLRTTSDTEVAPDQGQFTVTNNGRIFASGDARRAFAVWPSDPGRVTIVGVDLTTLSSGAPAFNIGQFIGSDPYIAGSIDISTFTSRVDIVYTTPAGGGLVQVRHRAATVPADFNAGTPEFDPNPTDLGQLLSTSTGVTLCPGTGPRVANGVAVWCEMSGSDAVVRRKQIGAATPAADRLNVTSVSLAREGSLVSGDPRVQQPLIADGRIVWAEDVAGTPRVMSLELLNGPLTAAANRVQTTFSVDDMRDLSRDVIASVQVHEAITSDIGLANLRAAPGTGVVLVTNDTVPQSEPVIDGTRVFFEDLSLGELLQVLDVSDTRWLRAPAALTFDPATSTEVTVWIENIGNEIRLVGRLLPLDSRKPPTLIDDAGAGHVAFFGPAKTDPTYAVGGRRVAFMVGTSAPFTLKLRTLDPTTGAASATAQVLAADAAGPFAIDPDGDEVVYVDTNNVVQRVSTATLAKTAVTFPAGVGTFIMIDVDDGMIVAQRGGNPERRAGIDGAGELFCARPEANVSGQVAFGGVLARGPKVAKLRNGTFLFAATREGIDAQACVLTCQATPVCAPFDVSNGQGDDTHIQVSRDGRVSFLSSELALNQVVVFDTFAQRWSFVTAGDFDRGGLSVAEGRLVWGDASLNVLGIFELTLQ